MFINFSIFHIYLSVQAIYPHCMPLVRSYLSDLHYTAILVVVDISYTYTLSTVSL